MSARPSLEDNSAHFISVAGRAAAGGPADAPRGLGPVTSQGWGAEGDGNGAGRDRGWADKERGDERGDERRAMGHGLGVTGHGLGVTCGGHGREGRGCERERQ